jgi:hypothetical protein
MNLELSGGSRNQAFRDLNLASVDAFAQGSTLQEIHCSLISLICCGLSTLAMLWRMARKPQLINDHDSGLELQVYAVHGFF